MFNFLTNLSIKTKLYSGFGLILAMCVALVVFGAVQLGTIKTSVGGLQTRSLCTIPIAVKMYHMAPHALRLANVPITMKDRAKKMAASACDCDLKQRIEIRGKGTAVR